MARRYEVESNRRLNATQARGHEEIEGHAGHTGHAI